MGGLQPRHRAGIRPRLPNPEINEIPNPDKGEAMTDLRELLRSAIMLSDELHNAEQNGVDLPAYVDEAWLHMSVAIEQARAYLNKRSAG